MRALSKINLHVSAFLLAFLVLALLAWQGARTQRSLLEANESVQHSFALITATQEMFSSLQDIETGTRGYVITGTESYLEPYHLARARLADQRQRFGELLARSEAPREDWLNELDRLIDRRLEIAGANIAARRDSGLASAAARLTESGGKETMDQLRDVFAEVATAERSQLAARDQSVETRVRHARWIGWIGGLFAAALFFWALWLVYRSQKRIEDQRRFLRSVVDADENLIFVTDQRRRILLCNDAFARVLNGRADALQGCSLDALGKMDVLAPFLEGDADLLEKGGELRIPELDVVDAHGQELCVQVYKRALVLSSGARLVLTVAVDISMRREMERMKNEFISNVSHELRTPLTAIRGALGMLVSGMLGSVDPQQKPLLDIAHKNSERLVRLINDILDVEKLASGRLDFNLSSQPVLPLVDQALTTNLPYAREYGVSLEMSTSGEADGEVLVDADRFAQIMANLLSNAIKHSPPGGVVTVGLERVGDSIEVSVSDQGPGIPDEFRERIFQRFAQADASSVRRLGGTGLGLAITRSLAEQMHGSVGFESEPGHGARFHVRLPSRPGAGVPATVPPPSSPVHQTVDRAILILEPDAEAAAFLATTLERQGYRPVLAHTAMEARGILNETPVHALTLSPTLRDEECIHFIQNLRERAAFRHLPILVVSLDMGNASANTQPRGNAVGVMDWLHKPIDPTRVLDVVKACLRPAGARPSILHVEDDADLRTLLANMLSPLNVDLIGVGSLAQARQKLAQRHHDLAILDLMLPDGDGSELIAELALASPPTPVVIFSALDSPVAESRLVLTRLVKSRHEGTELAALIEQLLKHWPASQKASPDEEVS